MKLYIVTNSCAYIVGVFNDEKLAENALLIATLNGVVGPYIETVIMNESKETV